jgi:hypothetical protein
MVAIIISHLICIYTIFATDENGCRAEASLDLGLVSFEDRVYFIFYMSCTYSGCHNARTEGLVNFRLFSNIQNKAVKIVERVVKRQMPPSRISSTKRG